MLILLCDPYDKETTVMMMKKKKEARNSIHEKRETQDESF